MRCSCQAANESAQGSLNGRNPKYMTESKINAGTIMPQKILVLIENILLKPLSSRSILELSVLLF
jgi:hypothetical protein